MNIFKVIYSYFYYLFVKMSYKMFHKDSKKEEIYHKKDKYVIFVKDVEVGKRLYEVVKFLNSTLIDTTPYARFKFTKYGITRNNTVKWICIQGYSQIDWDCLSEFEKLIQIQRFVEAMQAKGFVLDDTKFNNSECKSVSEFLSFFIESNENDKIERSNGCMIQYIHYVCSNGGNLKAFYEEFGDNVISEAYNIPYNAPVARMCYDYFKASTTPDSILEVLIEDQYGEYGDYPLVAIRDKLESKFDVTEKTDEYIIYDGCFKIYNKMSSEYENFLAEDQELIGQSKIATLEQMEAIIVDLDNHIIGYKFAKLDKQNMQMVFNPTSQNEIFSYVMEMVEYLEEYNLTSYHSKDFEIEKCLVCTCNSRNDFIFRCNTITDLFNLTTNDWYHLKEQVTVIFFKLLADYMAKKYGELTSKEQFLEKIEVRFLSPVVASEFVNFALEKPIDYQAATEELFKLFGNRTVSNNASFSYDARFCYNPLTVSFAFDYEAENKYNAKFEKGTTEKLPDGRTLVTLKQSCKISAFVHNEKSTRESIVPFLNVEDEHIKLVGISEIIVDTKRLNSDNMYNIIAYVTEPIKGKQLTDEALLQLNNRDLLKVAGYLFCQFNKYYIPWNNIWMDKEFKFYINYLDENFQVKRSANGINYASDFVQWVFDYLLKAGYNSSAFVGWKLPSYWGYKASKQYLLNLADKFNVYCDEHNIYYDGKCGQCPVCAQTKYLVPQNFEETFTKVFEDSIAVHYSIDRMYNLKVYKADYKTKVKGNVIRLVNLRLTYDDEHMLFFQDCFLPYKIALDTNNQFVGCVYKAAKFETTNGNTSDVCVDLEDGENLKNLPRLKSLIRLILQVKEITNHKLGFAMYPFTHVFLNTSHKKQVQILNIEFIGPCNLTDLMKTKQWTCEYIYKVLKSDPTIEFKRTAFPEGLDSILAKLTELAGQMKEYCPIHKMYYKSSYRWCPKCIDPVNQTKNIQFTNKSWYDAKSPINEGGEAFIYSHFNGTVAKVFKEGEINKSFKNKVLFGIFSKKDVLEKVNKENHKYKYVIPKEILIDSDTNEIFGYTMDFVENAFPISILRDKVEIKKLGFSKKDIFEIIITIGEGIETLHKDAGIYIGDLNGRNILFDTQKNVYFLDFDGMGVDEISPEFCTDDYIDPLSKKNRTITMKDDWYSFAVQAFYYLTYTHPFNGIYYGVRNRRKVLLEIPEKMERRISLLGNHGMKAPAIAESWDWMNDDLKSAFLSIFEGDNRESIVPYLKKQYQTLSTSMSEESFNNYYRINPKFFATELKAFSGNVVKIINSFAAICEKGNERYVVILTNGNNQVELLKENIHLSGGVQNINDILLSDDGKLAFLVYDKVDVLVVDLERKEVIYREYMPGAKYVVVNGRTMYFTGIYKGNYVISKRTFQSNGEIVKETIGFGSQRIKWFNVKFNTKFILIRQATQTIDELYCNSEKFSEFEYSSEEIAKQARYNVLYDDATKSWLVVNNFGKGIVIQMSGGSIGLDISKYVNDVNLANIYFERGNIYIPSQECMYIVNVNSKAVKKMECRKIMAPESKVYDINSDGFCVITPNVLYEVRKG